MTRPMRVYAKVVGGNMTTCRGRRRPYFEMMDEDGKTVLVQDATWTEIERAPDPKKMEYLVYNDVTEAFEIRAHVRGQSSYERLAKRVEELEAKLR